MAKYKTYVMGPDGTLQPISVYESKNGKVVRAPGGFHGVDTKKDKRFGNVVKLNDEFGYSSRIASLFSRTLAAYHEFLPGKCPYYHLKQDFQALKDLDLESPKGKRWPPGALQNPEGARAFGRLSWVKGKRFHFMGLPHHKLDLEAGTLTIEQFDASLFPFLTGKKVLAMQLLLMRVEFENVTATLEKSAFYHVYPEDKIDRILLECTVDNKN